MNKQKKFYFKRFSLKTKFITTTLSIFVLLAFMGFFTVYFINKLTDNYELQFKVKELASLQNEIRKAEKNYLLLEVSNQLYFETAKSVYLDEFQQVSDTLNKVINYLLKHKSIIDNDLDDDVSEISNNFYSYKTIFQKITQVSFQRGFKDYGLEGEMRKQIHYVETIINKNPSLAKYQVNMLMLRRHEKDYFLRKELSYRTKFENLVLKFIAEIKNDPSVDKTLSKEVIKALNSYQIIFFQTIDKIVEIGADENHGLLKQLNRYSNNILPSIQRINQIMSEKTQREIQRSIVYIFVLITLFSLVILFIVYKLASSIITSVKYLRKYILRLGRGELPERINKSSNDEISDMIESVNELTFNLRNTRDFAIEVGNGNFQTEINVFNNQGDLGSALVEMRERLLKVDLEKESNILKEQRQNWQNQGFAKFAEILQNTNIDLNNVFYGFIADLIKYINVNQGGIFILEESFDGEPYFDLKAAYAYDRNKLMQKKLLFNEGLIGRCAQEAQPIYLTELPPDYLHITSGIGGKSASYLLLVPLISDQKIQGVLELASLSPIEKHVFDFVIQLGETIATSIAIIKMNRRSARIVEELQAQTKELKQQEEELKQNIEELEATREEVERNRKDMLDITNAINNTLAYFEMNLNGEILKYNDNFAQLAGIEPMATASEEVLIHKDLLSIDELEYSKYQNNLKSLSEGISVKTLNRYFLNQARVFESYTPIKNAQDEVIKIIVIGHEINVHAENDNIFLNTSLELELSSN